MDQPFESDVMDDLAAETPPSSADVSYDEYDEIEEPYDEDESFPDEMNDYGDSSEGLADLNDRFDTVIHRELSTGSVPKEGWDSLTCAIADALATPDSQAFLRRLSQSLRHMAGQSTRPDRNGKRSTRTKSADKRATQPSTPIARVANLAAQLVREETEPRDALDAFLELAETDRANLAVIPIIAGLSLQQAIPNVARKSRLQRQQLVQSVSRATRTLTQKQGTQAMAAMPRILDAIERNAVANHLPQTNLPGAIQRITSQVAANADLVHRLVYPTQPTSGTPLRSLGKAAKGSVQRLVFDRPVEISIRYL